MLDNEIISLHIKKDNLKKNVKIKNKCRIIYIIFLIIMFSFLITEVMILKYKLKNIQIKFSEQLNNFKSKDELLQMCYNSRSFYYIRDRMIAMRKKYLKYNESNLITIQDKINYLTIHESPDYKSKIVDKIKLHEYSKKILGKDICVPILNIYKDVNDINLNELPEKFVLKCNHGSAMNIICKDKSKFNLAQAKYILNKWKKINYGFETGEFQYINVEREIFAEIFLQDNIEDYKVYCFHGEPKYIRVQKKINEYNKINNYYDLEWNLTDLETGLLHFYRNPKITFKKPKNLDLMIEYSRKLSSEFVFVRVDFYDIDGKIYLGELTFTPSNSGFHLKNNEQSKQLGNFINVSKIKKDFFN